MEEEETYTVNYTINITINAPCTLNFTQTGKPDPPPPPPSDPQP